MPSHEIIPSTASAEIAVQPTDSWESVQSAIDSLELSPDPHQRAELLAEGITADAIIDATKRLHHVLAPGIDTVPISAAMHVSSPDGTNKRELMKPAERRPLFEHAAALVRDLAAHRTPDTDQAFLDRAGNIVALSVVLAHQYGDGNGRTARALGHVIREGYDPAADQGDLKLVASNRPESGYRITSYLPTREGVNMTPDEILNQAAALEVPLNDVSAYEAKARQVFTTPYNA